MLCQSLVSPAEIPEIQPETPKRKLYSTQVVSTPVASTEICQFFKGKSKKKKGKRMKMQTNKHAHSKTDTDTLKARESANLPGGEKAN